ncbi:MAG: hypothetical protein J5742_01905 [Alphaproteobacteria bacterium]|nr:hypothetical protein [Alphaproteobacteria bacterium]
MFKKLKMRLAAKRMQRRKDFSAEKAYMQKNAGPMTKVILWPIRMIARIVRWVWDLLCAICAWIWAGLCDINIVGLINLALLIAIIVLLSMLIIDILNYRRKPVVVNGPAKNVPVEFATKGKPAKNVPLPMRRDAKTGNLPTTTNVVPVKPSEDPTLRPQGDGNIYGDVIIESRGEAIVLKNGSHIRGNLYLQRMRKYVLPCNITIEGNMFLRDLNLLEFCGDFTVKGNIYVSPRSSFGPIPRNARLGGQIIL